MEKHGGFDVDFAWNLVPRRPHRRIDEWNEAALPAVSLYAAEDVRGDEFAGRIQIRQLDQARIMRAHGNAVVLDRAETELAFHPDRLQIKLQVGGEVRMSYGGADIHLTPGDIVVEDMAVPARMQMSDAWQQACVSIDKAAIDRLFPDERPLHGTVLRGAAGVSRLASSYLGSLAETAGALPAPAAQAGLRHVCELVSLAQSNGLVAERENLRDGVRAARLTRAKHYIEQHLDDAALTPAQVAIALGISVRQLYNLFERSGTSVAEFIRGRRLARCLKDLSDPKNANRSVAHVAFRWGFSDLSTFHRSFRKAFGVTPGDVRLATDERTERLLATAFRDVA